MKTMFKSILKMHLCTSTPTESIQVFVNFKFNLAMKSQKSYNEDTIHLKAPPLACIMSKPSDDPVFYVCKT